MRKNEKSYFIWGVTLHVPVKVKRCFEGTYCIHLQGLKLIQTGNQF
jgi:hypothetical protein